MASQATQWLELEGELITVIERCAPNHDDKQPFKWRTHKEQESAAAIESAAGAVRLFQFNPPGPDIPDTTIGHTTRHKTLRFDLQIIYPGGPIWAAYAAMSIAVWQSTSLAVLFGAMFAMGCFASIYHPAGVGLISHHTTPENRPMALGYHGILGSVGIAPRDAFLGAIRAVDSLDRVG